MRVKVRLFAAAREAVGEREIALDLDPSETVGELLQTLTDRFPGLQRFSQSVRLAINHEYVDGGHRLSDGDEVAIIPPVSGGVDRFDVVDAPLSLDALSQSIAAESSGAIASFLGIVRKRSRGREVLHLEYEAYREMAIAKMREIGDEIHARWPVDEIAIVHRVGRLRVGEASIAICVAAPHRREALAACTYAIERVKTAVPIWKKEVWSDGSEWIGTVSGEEAELRSGLSGCPTDA